jgi:hypothetical protein
MFTEQCGFVNAMGPGAAYKGAVEKHAWRALCEEDIEELCDAEESIACLEGRGA